MTDRMVPGRSDVLIVVDIQNDFCPGGALSVPAGDKVVPVINQLASRFRHVVLTQDWHPRGHLSFASSHSGKKPYQTIEVAYGPQILWPDHCVQGTPGAEFRDDLEITHAELVLRKGYHREIDSYSAFYENDRACRLPARTRFCAGVAGRARLRLLCALFRRGRQARGLRRRGVRGCLPRH
jgi:nicotinamidase/pyrazinamidase